MSRVEKRMDVIEERTERDGFARHRTLTRADAGVEVQRVLMEAVRNLEDHCDAALKRVEAARREKARAEWTVAVTEMIDNALKKHERESLLGFRTMTKETARRKGLIE